MSFRISTLVRVLAEHPIRMPAMVAALSGAFVCGSSRDVLAQATSQTCALASYCALVTNSSSGPALHGKGTSSYGVVGNSSSGGGVLGSTNAGMSMLAGIDGESTDNNGSDTAGGFGLSAGFNSNVTPPQFGVLSYGKLYGLYGDTLASGSSSSYGYGVAGFDYSKGPLTYNTAVLGQSQHGFAVLGATGALPTLGYQGNVPVGVYAVSEPLNSSGALAYGVVAESRSIPIRAVNTSTSDHPTVDLGPANYFIYSIGGNGNFSVDTSGDVSTSGTVTSSAFATEARAASGVVRRSYSPHTTAPMMEDTGDAQLVAGRAVVQIDASLADVIDMRRGYHVFLTPGGDCKGLYVAERTRYGFVVRELQGGRSNLTFDYRIVAKPIAEDGQRLAIVRHEALAPRPRIPAAGPSRIAPPPDPVAQMREKLGPARFAKAVRDLEARYSTL